MHDARSIIRRMFHIVEDADFVSELVEAIIQDHGHETMSFNCPEDYISFINSSDFKNPVAVFTDITMPGINGYEMMNVVSEIKPDLKFVVMTSEPKIRSEYIDKACMYLGKPFTPDNLIKVVDSLLRCHAFSPADDHGCTSVDNREVFPIESWFCPQRCGDCSSDCS